MATLITGGSGFVGLSIAERLIAEGESVVLFDLAAPIASMLSRLALAGATLITGDVRDGSDIDRALAANNIDRVIHAAAMTPNTQRERDEPRRIVEVNIVGTVNLLERLAARPAVKRVVVLSSVAVYGFSQPSASGLFEEDLSPPAPASLYGITKLAAEQAAMRIGQLRGLDVRIARLGPVYGTWENPTAARDILSPHHQILSMALQNREVLLPRPMAADWIYSRDAAEGIARLCNAASLHHAIYHVSGGTLTDLAQWCGIVSELVPGFRWKLVDSDQQGNVVYSLPKDRAPLDIARLSGDTGFRPSRTLEAAAREYLDWVQARPRASSPLLLAGRGRGWGSPVQ
jgi:nucleoside-diphosphate-sugar epimerase